MIERLLLLGVLALAYAAPWPLLVNAAAWFTGDPTVYALYLDTAMWAHHALFFALFLVVAAVLWASDRWLAGIVALAGAQTFVLGPRVTTLYLLLGVGVVMLARHLPSAWRDTATRWIGISGAVQALMMLAQWKVGVPAVGTLGVTGLAAGYVAMTGLLLPGWLLPLAGVAVVATGSRAGLVAFVLGLGVRYAPVFPLVTWALVLLVAGLFVVGALSRPGPGARAAVHRLAFEDWRASPVAVVVGYGLGTWSERMRRVVQRAGFAAIGEGPARPKYYHTAHDDALQWLYETGLLGASLLAGWLIRWRRHLLAPPFAPAFAVLAVMALAWFPLHDLRTGMLAALLVGLGSPTEAA